MTLADKSYSDQRFGASRAGQPEMLYERVSVVFPDFSTVAASGLRARFIDGAPIEMVPLRGLWAKRVADIVFALLGLVFLAPLLVMLALVIKGTSSGPVFFRQVREGRCGRLFRVYKFRSMSTDVSDWSGVRQTVEGDPRVTAVGRFMRKYSIDELPQLLNVLFGDMSLVGPRPHVPGMLAAGTCYRTLVPYYGFRERVTPGITGWAQVNGPRGPTVDSRLAIARVNHDVAYIQNWSFWLDIKIIVLTIRRELLSGTGI